MIMTSDPRKNLASMVMARISKPKDEAPAEPPSPDEGLRSAMEDLIQAIKSDDVDAAMMAFKAAMSLCPDDEDQEQP